MEMMASKVQKGRYLFCPNGSHLSLYDDPQVYTQGIVQFLRDVDSAAF
jgi:proline iminopeptidase